MSLKHIGVLAHPARPQTAPVCSAIEAFLSARGLQVWARDTWTEDEITAQVASSDLVIAIGGDGAMLRAGRVCGLNGVPVLGVNMGKLGFLTEIARDAWPQAVEAVLADRYWVEQRMMLTTSVLRDGAVIARSEALNDVVLSRGSALGMVELSAYIDGGWTTTYACDALIVASATGSTAYALACGGPILPPELRSILLVPVAPHLSLDRPMVLPEGAIVEIHVGETRTEPFLAVDGVNAAMLLPGDRVRVQASAFVSRFVRLREKTYFYRSLLDRLEPRVSTEPR